MQTQAGRVSTALSYDLSTQRCQWLYTVTSKLQRRPPVSSDGTPCSSLWSKVVPSSTVSGFGTRTRVVVVVTGLVWRKAVGTYRSMLAFMPACLHVCALVYMQIDRHRVCICTVLKCRFTGSHVWKRGVTSCGVVGQAENLQRLQGLLVCELGVRITTSCTYTLHMQQN